jgi:hypothetical protein
MDVHSQLLIWEFCQSIHLELWWQNERGLTDWFSRTQHAQGVPLPSYRYKKGDEWVYIKKTSFFNVLEKSACQSRLAM